MRNTYRSLLSLIACTILFPLKASAGEEPPISIQLSFPGDDFDANEPIKVRYRIKNTASTSVHVLSWGTPLQDNRENFFRVTRDGREVGYRGPYYKRGDPGADEYVVITAGESVTVVTDLTTLYEFNGTGPHEIALRHHLHDVVFSPDKPPRRRAAFTPLRPLTSSTGFTITAAAKPAPAPTPKSVAGISYVDCSSSKEKIVKKAWDLVVDDFQAVVDELELGAESTDRWHDKNDCVDCEVLFGNYAHHRVDTLTTTWDATEAYVYGSTFPTFYCKGDVPDCGKCKHKSTVAHTCGPPDIGLCDQFWDLSGEWAEDSRAGAIVHELSHWAGTHDYKYGCSNCKSLASDDADKAVLNSDSYEYFAEYTVASKVACGLAEHVVISLGVLPFFILLGVILRRTSSYRRERG